MGLLTPLLYGIGTGIPIVVGAAVGAIWEPPRPLVAAALAFASGSLITGLAFELFEPAFRTAGLLLTGASLLTGTGIYVGVKYLLELRSDTGGLALLATVILDGTAENLTLGVVLVGNSVGAPLALLAGIAANNLPEAVGGATGMIKSGQSTYGRSASGRPRRPDSRS